jgi:glycosyltransferase involved in cell wall biosynthesis
MRFSDALLFYTDQEVTEYSSRVASLESRTVLALNNGLNTSRIAKLRRSYDAQDRLKSILFIGRLTKKSNIQLLVGAMASPLLSDARLQIIGDGELRYDIQEMIEALGISDRITLHGSLLCEEFIAEIANLCRVFVYPGEVGLSLIHAMAYGLPAVVHSDRWGHMPEIAAFENGVTGLQFEKDNRESLIVNLVKLLDDVHLLNRQSISSVSTVSSSFNVQDMVLRFKQLVEKVRVVDS